VEAKKSLLEAFVKFQSQMPTVPENKINPHFKSKYADLAAIMSAARAPLAANGLAVTQSVGCDASSVRVTSTLIHVSGESMSGEPCVLPVPQVAQTPQGFGSAITYGRRYSLAALLGIVTDVDDDANEAQGTKPNTPPAPSGAALAAKVIGTSSDGRARTHEDIELRYGRAKGKRLSEVDDASVAYYLAESQKTVNDPAKAQYLSANTRELAVLQAEARFRGMGV
jgi:hypothetical protein